MEFSLTDCFAGGPSYALVWAVTLSAYTTGFGLWQSRRLLGAARRRLVPRLADRRLRRQIATLVPTSSARGLVAGPLVRLRGVVGRAEVRFAPLSGLPAVVSRHRVHGIAGGTIDDGLVARPFLLELDSGDPVLVAANEALAAGALSLLDDRIDRWQGTARKRLAGAYFAESRLAPGDVVEVIGVLTSRPDPTASSRGHRGTPMRWVMGAGGAPVTLAFETALRPHERAAPAPRALLAGPRTARLAPASGR